MIARSCRKSRAIGQASSRYTRACHASRKLGEFERSLPKACDAMRMACKQVVASRIEICCLVHFSWEVCSSSLPTRPTDQHSKRCSQCAQVCRRRPEQQSFQTCDSAEGIRVGAGRDSPDIKRCTQGTESLRLQMFCTSRLPTQWQSTSPSSTY